jgi:hypothetical protein
MWMLKKKKEKKDEENSQTFHEIFNEKIKK